MDRSFKKVLIKGLRYWICGFLCVCVMLSGVSAARVEASGLPCEIVVTIVDKSGTCRGSVNMTISTSGGVQQFFFGANFWGEDNPQILYTTDFGLANITAVVDTPGWRVVEADTMEEITSAEFEANGSTAISLVVLSTEDNADDVPADSDTAEPDKQPFGDLPDVGTGNGDSTASSGIGEDVEGAEEVFQNFLDATAIMETDPSWDGIINSVHGTVGRNFREDMYLSSVKDATAEQWQSFSNYEIFVYTETYLRFANMVGAESDPFGEYFAKGEKGIQRYLNDYVVVRMYTGTNSEEILSALTDLVNWQAEFILKYNYPYNFITGRSYADETRVITSADPVPQESVSEESTESEPEDLGLTKEEEDEIREALEEDGIVEETPGIWSNVGQALLDHWFSIMLAVILLIAYLVVRYIRKKKSVDEMTSDGK